MIFVICIELNVIQFFLPECNSSTFSFQIIAGHIFQCMLTDSGLESFAFVTVHNFRFFAFRKKCSFGRTFCKGCISSVFKVQIKQSVFFEYVLCKNSTRKTCSE